MVKNVYICSIIIIYTILFLWVIAITYFALSFRLPISGPWWYGYPYAIMTYVCSFVPIRSFILPGVLEIDPTSPWDGFTYRGILHNRDNAYQPIYAMRVFCFFAGGFLFIKQDISFVVIQPLTSQLVKLSGFILFVYVCFCTINKIKAYPWKD